MSADKLAPDGWREAVKRVRDQLGQAGGTGTAGAQNSITERAVGGWILDAIEDELAALATLAALSARIEGLEKADAVRQDLDARIAVLQDWMSKNGAQAVDRQRHLDEGSQAQEYWHYGYLSALLDVRAALSPIPAEPR